MGHIFEAYPPPPPLSLQFFGLCVYPIKAVSFPATSCLFRSQNSRRWLCQPRDIPRASLIEIRELNDDGDGNEDLKKAIGVMRKTTTLYVHHAFLDSSLPSLHNYDVKTPDRKL